MKVIVIGGVAAGMSAASKIKRMDQSVEVVVYEKGGFLSYGACGLPYYVGGFNNDYKKMIARTKEEFEQMGMDVFLHHEVVKVMPSEKKLLVRNHETGDIFIDTYDKLMIGTGASAIRPPLPGVDQEGIYQLKTLEDGLRLKEVLQQESVRRVVVIGGGYIGIECIDACLHLGKEVTCIEFANCILTPFDKEISNVAMKELLDEGAKLRLGEKVIGFKGTGKVEGVETTAGVYEADLVIMAIGVRPATGFLKDTTMHLAPNGGIIVDRELRTSIEDVWAAGDCSVVYHRGLEENVYLPLGTVANKCGRIAGENIMGKHTKFVGALGSAAIKVGDLELGRTGLGEAEARKQGIDYKTVTIDAYDHPAYYPDPTPITIKLIYEVGTYKLLGAQAVGKKGAVMRIDVLAVAIQGGMTIKELGMTDLVYAPPFAGVWDAIHIACNAAK